MACVGISTIETGLDIADVIPKDTYQGDFLEVRFEYFDFFSIQIVTEQADYTTEATQRLMLDMHTELVALRNEDGSSYLVEPAPAFWLSSFITWVGAAETAEPPRSQRLTASGLVPAAEFYDYYYAWLADDSITVATITAQDFNYSCSSVVTERLTASGPVECTPGERGQITYAFVSLYLDGLGTTADFTAMIISVRAVCDKYVGLGLPNFPYGQPFTFWEQYVNIWAILLQNIVFSLAVVFLLSLALLMSPTAAGLITMTIFINVLEIAGLMGLIGVKLSAIPVVSLIMSVGIAVEFTVHLVLAYLDAVFDNTEGKAYAEGSVYRGRAAGVEAALTVMFAPVLDGGLSTLLGVLMLAFSEYGFVRKYFFAVFFSVVLFGLINGLVLMPVLLHKVGPLPMAAPAEEVAWLAGGDDAVGEDDRRERELAQMQVVPDRPQPPAAANDDM